MGPESMSLLMANMNNYDRRALDKAISAIQGASVGQIQVTDRCSARLQGLHSNRKQSFLDWQAPKSSGVRKVHEPGRTSPHSNTTDDAEHIQIFVSEPCRSAASKHLTLKGASKVRPGI